MRILFMGTPDFARMNLQALYEAGENIVGVVATPDKPKGRGLVLTPCEVKKYALEVGLPVYQPVTLKDGAFLDTLKELDPELIIVVAYGRILPQYVLDYPKYGCINGHASILPEYRGAAPIQRAIIDGKAETGVSIQRMDIGLDTGDVIHVEKVDIDINDNFESVHDKLAAASSKALSSITSALEVESPSVCTSMERSPGMRPARASSPSLMPALAAALSATSSFNCHKMICFTICISS
jgi:methionyl-tRNA formyltransferase